MRWRGPQRCRPLASKRDEHEGVRAVGDVDCFWSAAEQLGQGDECCTSIEMVLGAAKRLDRHSVLYSVGCVYGVGAIDRHS
jgi:hypothetical protein